MAEDPEFPDSDEQDESAHDRSRSSESSRPFRHIEWMVPDLLRKGLEKGIEAGLSSWEKNLESALGKTGAVQGALREALSDGKLPRELAGAFFQQIDETKNGVLRVVAGEFRDFLEATDLAGELKNALTSLSFEIRTEVRFIPNDAGTGVRPQVKAAGKVKQTEKESSRPPKRRWRRSEPAVERAADDPAPEASPDRDEDLDA